MDAPHGCFRGLRKHGAGREVAKHSGVACTPGVHQSARWPRITATRNTPGRTKHSTVPIESFSNSTSLGGNLMFARVWRIGLKVREADSDMRTVHAPASPPLAPAPAPPAPLMIPHALWKAPYLRYCKREGERRQRKKARERERVMAALVPRVGESDFVNRSSPQFCAAEVHSEPARICRRLPVARAEVSSREGVVAVFACVDEVEGVVWGRDPSSLFRQGPTCWLSAAT